ncbi:MAG: insulinase family protein [Candidatus Stahlbacteria bacterium]|nr:MAG: insulinase family protein [Candidatus Stahlbacteria bacterium]
MRKIAILFIILSISLLGQKESPMAKEIKKIKFPEIEWKLPEVGVDIKRVELPSGAILFLKENHSVPLIEINIFIKGGSSYLENGKRAVSELFTIMIERGGTENFSPSEFAEKLEINAISFDITENGYYYGVNMLTDKNVIDTALVLLEEALFQPIFDYEIMKIEKRKLAMEWEKKLDDPNSLLKEISNLVLYKDHPAGGIPDFNLLETIDGNRLVELKDRFVQPSNMIIGIVGDFESEDMKQKIKRIFCKKYNTDEIIGEIPALTPEAPKKVYLYNIKRPQALFHIQHIGKSAPFPEMYNVMIMNFILGGGGFTSRIVKKVRVEKGFAYRTRSYYSTFSPLSGEFYVYCGTRQDAVHEASRCILEEIKRIREEEVSCGELKVAKESVINSTVTRLGNDWNYIPRLLSLEILGLPLNYYITLNDNIEKVDVDDVLNAARDFINPEKLSIVIIGDKEKIDLDAFREQFGEVEFINYEIPGI